MDNYIINYTTINHTARLQLGITNTEYCFLDLICNLSNDPRFDRWCIAQKTKLAKMAEISEQHLHRLISKFTTGTYKVKGKTVNCPILLEKDSKTKYIRTTLLWYETVVIKKELIQKYREERKNKNPTQQTFSNSPKDEKNPSDFATKITSNGNVDKRNPEITRLQQFFFNTFHIANDNCPDEKSRQNFSNFLRTDWQKLLTSCHITGLTNADGALKSPEELTKMLILLAKKVDSQKYTTIHIRGSNDLWFNRSNILRKVAEGQQRREARAID